MDRTSKSYKFSILGRLKSQIRTIFYYWVVSMAFVSQMDSLALAEDRSWPTLTRSLVHASQDFADSLPIHSVVVGVGRSPTGFIAALQELGQQAINLPFSQANHWAKFSSINSYQKALDAHIEYYLGPLVKAGKKIIIVDYVVNGSFKTAISEIQKSLQRLGYPPDLDYRVLSSSYNVIGKESWADEKHFFNLDKYEGLEISLRAMIFKPYAEYSGFAPNSSSIGEDGKYLPPPKNESFMNLKVYLREQIPQLLKLMPAKRCAQVLTFEL